MQITHEEYENTYRLWRGAVKRQRGVFLSKLPYNATKAPIKAFLEQTFDSLEICQVY